MMIATASTRLFERLPSRGHRRLESTRPTTGSDTAGDGFDRQDRWSRHAPLGVELGDDDTATGLEPAVLTAWIDRIADRSVRDVIWTRSRQVRQVLQEAARLGADWRFVRGLHGARRIAVGRDTARALRDLGLPAQLTIRRSATTDPLTTLAKGGLIRRPIAVVHGDDQADAHLLAGLERLRNIVHPLPAILAGSPEPVGADAFAATPPALGRA